MTTAPPPSRSTAAARLTFCRRLLLCCALLASGAAPAGAQTTQPFRPTLLAYGTSNKLWVATVEPYKDGTTMRTKTVIRSQELPGGGWGDVGTLYTQALGLAQVQGDLAILVEDGVWKRVGVSGLATGPVIPGTGPVLGWGSSATTLYAVRSAEGGKAGLANPSSAASSRPAAAAPAIRPATQLTTTTRTTATATTRPAATTTTAGAAGPTTRPATPVLMKYDRGGWVAVADLPTGIDAAPVALTVFNDKPVLAAAAGDAVRTYTLSDGAWQDWGEIRAQPRAARFDLVLAPNLVALWTIDLAGGMKLHVRREGDGWSPVKNFELPGGVPPDAARTLAAAGQEFRLEIAKDGKVSEQRYDLAGAKVGTLGELPAPQIPRPNHTAWILQTVALLVMVVVLITFYRRRAARAPVDEGNAPR